MPEHLSLVIDYSYWIGQRDSYLEMEGIAQTLGLPTRKIVVVNFAYELIAYCTSLIAR